MSQLEVDKIIPQSGTTLTIGDSGDTITISAGATLSASLNADNLDSGTIPDARITGAYTGITNLTMSGTLTVGDGHTIGNDGSFDNLLIQSSSNENIEYNSANGSHIFKQNGGEVFRIDDTTGNVGIGVSNPIQKLQVVDSASGSVASILAIQNTNGSAGTGAELRLVPSNYNNNIGSTARWSAIRAINSGTGNGTSLQFLTNSNSNDPATRLTISIDGKVGIGETSPDDTLHVNSGTQNDVAKFESTDTTASLILVDSATTTDGNRIQTIGDTMNFQTAGSESMRIDSSGNLLVGKTSDSSAVSTEGINLRPFTTPSTFTRDGGTALQIARLTSDGSMQKFYKDGTTVGSIGIQSSGFYIDGEASHAGIRFAGSSFLPRQNGADTDNAVDLGTSDGRWQDLWLGGGLYVGGTGTANKLDDYEEGTWTPQVQDNSSNNASMGSSAQNFGKYTKVGNIVFVSARVETTSVSGLSSANTVNISGLPFTGVNQRSTGAVNFHDFNLPSGATALSLYFEQSTDKFQLFKERSGSNMIGLSISELGVTSFGFSATYITD